MLDHEIALIRDLWVQGYRTKDICKAATVASRTVRKYVKDLTPRTTPLRPKYDVQLMRSLRQRGALIEEIVEALGVPKTVVSSSVRDIPCPWGQWKLACSDFVDPLRILELRADGLDNASIAERLGTSRGHIRIQGAAAARDPEPYRIRREYRRRLKQELMMLSQARSGLVCQPVA